MASDPRLRDQRVCSACGEPVGLDGNCSAVETMLAGVEELAERGGPRVA